MGKEKITRQALETTVKIGVVALLTIWCFQIVRPFAHAIAWGIIIAVAVFPLYRYLCSLLGDRPRAAAMVMTIGLLLIIVLPLVLLISLLTDNLQALAHQLRDGTLRVPPPSSEIQAWPVIGAPLYTFWHLAATNLGAAIQQLAPQLKEISGILLSAAAMVGLSMMQFVLAVVLSGVFLAYSEEGYRLSRAIGRRLAGDRGIELVDLCEATTRSVARGVLGVAVIQAAMAGLGMVMVGVPFAGLLTVVALFLGVVQVGVGIVVLPAAVYVFSTHDTLPAILFLIWAILVTFTDNVLKPLLLGRGVDVPMMVIFVGALGGMITSGIIGLFVGAILLAIGYKMFVAWLDMSDSAAEASGSGDVPGF